MIRELMLLCALMSAFYNNCAQREKKLWTFLVYMSADNDLYPFSDRNIRQMCQLGSNEHVNIVVHLDIHKPNQPKVTRFLFIERNSVVQIGPDRCMDSGNEETLIDALMSAITNFPSEHFCLVFWNHGSGDLNPVIGKSINPSQLFYYNAQTKLIELDRSIGFLDYINGFLTPDAQQRGVCFDETNSTYLDDKKLKRALTHFCAQQGKKIDVILFDACLMAGIGTAWLMAPFADYMVASEEVALGPGYDYTSLLLGLHTFHLPPRDFARHVVASYEKTYQKITPDYTQSALELAQLPQLAQNVNDVAELLIFAIKQQSGNSVRNIIRQSMLCVTFDEPSYRDIGSFYQKLLSLIKSMQFIDQESEFIKEKLSRLLREGLEILQTLVVANATGSRIKNACGLYIYLPSKKIHSSYPATEFAQHNSWKTFLETLLATT